MKKPIIFISLLISTLCYSQDQAFPAQSNLFSEANNSSADTITTNGIPTGGPSGDDPQDAPIDDHIPLLFLCAVSIIFYATYKNKIYPAKKH